MVGRQQECGVLCLSERQRLGRNARQTILEQMRVAVITQRVKGLYARAFENFARRKPGAAAMYWALSRQRRRNSSRCAAGMVIVLITVTGVSVAGTVGLAVLIVAIVWPV